MKKILSLIISATIVISCMNISFAQSNLPDDEMSTNVLLDYLEALKNENIDEILGNSISKEFPALDDYQRELVEFYQSEYRKIISSYSIVDQINESDGYKYIVRFSYEGGLVVEGSAYTQRINNEWKVVIPEDRHKRMCKVIDVSESDREAFETYEQRVNAIENSADTPVQSEFSDISGHWAEDTINKWKEQGVITGYPDGTFKPDNSVTRAEVAKIITISFDLQEASSLEYDDIYGSEWYYSHLEYAARYIPSYKLPVGYESMIPYEYNQNGFLPECNAIRMHVAEALVVIKMEKENLDIELPTIQDIQKALYEPFEEGDYRELFATTRGISGNVRRMFEYTWLAKELDVMQGDSDGYFRPYDEITRAELLTVIDRMER